MSTSSAEGSPASPSASQDDDSVRTTSGGSGPSFSEPFAWFDPDSCCWRTSQVSLLPASEELPPTWPRAGTTSNGIAYQLPPSAPRTSAIDSSPWRGCGPNSDGLWPIATTGDHSTRFAQGGMPLGMAARMWPTPTVQDAKNNAGPSQWKRNSDPLNVAVKRWPTPRASDGKGAATFAAAEKWAHRANLPEAVQLDARGMWPTPTASDATGGPGSSGRQGGDNLRTAVRYPTPRATRGGSATETVQQMGITGQLNPQWVEWLMGFPAGWTDLEPSETP